jgi:hypothetical protein
VETKKTASASTQAEAAQAANLEPALARRRVVGLNFKLRRI